MPRWVCPFCRAKMSVRDGHLGQSRPCANCKRSSVVEDCDRTDDVGVLDQFPDDRLALPKLIQKEPAIGVVAKFMLIATGACGVLAVAIQDHAEIKSLAFAGIVSTGLLAVILWPFYTMANDTRSILRILQNGKKDR